ncbi:MULTISPECIES: RES family NAD+ phosphorylase [unclassified Microbulbifer]|uniref:RES family NAD+ phosphorylase n=1 Tax=unclassified Microbulbifer TaxID=2619833 RepID=UPI0027E4D28F|nr:MULTISPECIES: RES family NAD+ phosphorylase [unclassified Microbulbifer]
MPKFPEPPGADRLEAISPALRHLPAGELVWRVHFLGGEHPCSWRQWRDFGPTSSRFDHQLPDVKGLPQAQNRKILYGAIGAGAVPTCLAEIFQNTRFIDRTNKRPCLSAFALTRELELLDLTGPWPTRAGCSMAINSGPRARARRWAQQFYQAYSRLDGILYPSSMYANSPAVAFFERAENCAPAKPSFHRMLADPALEDALVNIASDIGYGLSGPGV